MGAGEIKSESYFMSNPELQKEYGNYENYMLKIQKQIKDTPLWEKGKIAYEAATFDYQTNNSLFQKLKSKQNSAQYNYQSFLTQYMKKNNYTSLSQVPSGILSQFRAEAGLTADLINNTDDAEFAADLALDARFRAVDMQRHGLYFNG